MTELVKQLAERWEGHGPWAIATTIVSVVLATLVSKVIDAKWKHRYDQKMERFKAGLERDRLVFNNAISSLNAASGAANPKILDSVDQLWKGLLQLKSGFPNITLFADILTKEEWCNLPNVPSSANKLGDFSDKEFIRFLNSLPGLEVLRPFVGEILWARFFAYRAYLLRFVVLVEEGYRKNNMGWWYDDKGIQEYIRIMLNEGEIVEVESAEVGRHGRISRLVESKIVLEMDRIISGHRSADNSMFQARKMLLAVDEVGQTSSHRTSTH